MKLATTGEKVVRIGHQTEQDFKIKATAKAFHILSSGLYKDKIGAILRELSANAYDAHVAKGCPEKPFLVHVPDQMNPFLSIRDFGPGLSHEHALELYTTYFESTKTESNDYIGALGLGSKSPFSYTKAFTVVSRHAGRQSTYDCFIGEAGLPSIALRHVCDIDPADTGLEVIVPVTNRNDYAEFRNKLNQTFRYYPVLPKIEGFKNFSIAKNAVVMEGKGWRLFESKGYHDNKPVAIMGIIGYPIDYQNLTSVSGSEKDKFWESEEAKRFLTSNMEIEFEVGALEFTAGREELSYERHTVNSVRERLKQIIDEIRTRVSTDFAACGSYREAKVLYGKTFSYYSPLTRILGDRFVVQYKGRKLSDLNYNIDLVNYKGITLRHYRNSDRGGIRNFTTYIHKKDHPYEGRIQFAADKKIQFFIQDMADNKYSSRIFHWRSQNNQEAILVETADAAELKLFQEEMDGYTFINVSTLPKEPAGEKTRAKVRKLHATKRYRDEIKTPHYTDWWSETEVTVEDGGVYIVTKNLKFQVPAPTADDSKALAEANDLYSSIFVAARALKIINAETDEVYAVPISESKPFVQSTEWKDFWTWVGEKAQAYVNARPDLTDQVLKTRAIKEFDNIENSFQTLDGLRATAKHLPKDHPVVKLMDLEQECRAIPADLGHVEHLATTLGIDLPKPQNTAYDLKGQYTALADKYPLLRHLTAGYRYHHDRAPAVKIAEYITMMDAAQTQIKAGATS